MWCYCRYTKHLTLCLRGSDAIWIYENMYFTIAALISGIRWNIKFPAASSLEKANERIGPWLVRIHKRNRRLKHPQIAVCFKAWPCLSAEGSTDGYWYRLLERRPTRVPLLIAWRKSLLLTRPPNNTVGQLVLKICCFVWRVVYSIIFSGWTRLILEKTLWIRGLCA